MIKTRILGFVLFLFVVSLSSAQNAKDTLYFKTNSKYMDLKKNYEGVHSFIFKDMEFVTSAFGKIVEENLFYFAQGFPPKYYKLKPNRIYDLKTFLNKNENLFRDQLTNKMDAYKIMEYFDKYVVFFQKEKVFIKVVVNTSLYE